MRHFIVRVSSQRRLSAAISAKNDRKQCPEADRLWDYDFGLMCSAKSQVVPSAFESVEQSDCRHHVALAGRAARERLGIMAPLLGLPVLVDMAGSPGRLAV